MQNHFAIQMTHRTLQSNLRGNSFQSTNDAGIKKSFGMIIRKSKMQENEKYKNERAVIYTNEGDSSSLERPSLQRLRKTIRNQEMDVVLVAHFHFLTSNPEHLVLLYREMRAHDVELLSANEGPFNETVQGQLLSGKSKSEMVASLVEKGKRERPGDRSPMDERIDGYLFSVLSPQLQRYDIKQHGIDQIVTDIDNRLHGVLSRWHDEDWRDTILEVGREEGTFFLPKDAPLSIRSLIVVAIRNSLLADWHVEQKHGGKGRKIDDICMRWITSEAIRYFDACSLPTLPDASASPDNPFADLEQNFPLAWHIFSQLAEANREDNEQQKRSKAGLAFEVDLPSLASLPEFPESTTRVQATTVALEGTHSAKAIVDSGINPYFDDHLLTLLDLVRNNKGTPFYSDSWKALTRNPSKLFFLVNWILAYQGIIITPNYLLSPQIACIRTPLWRAIHFSSEGKEIFAVLAHPGGLFPSHRKALASIADQFREL
jgi:hypothetical protein